VIDANITVTLAGVDVTRYMDKDEFPEWFEESMKGDGYFEYEVKPLVFVINTYGTGVVPMRLDQIEIVDNVTGKYLLRGQVDSIFGDETYHPELTVYPQALFLKDTIIGDPLFLTIDDWVASYIFGVRSIHSTLTDIVNRVNLAHGTNMYVTEASVPPVVGDDRRFGSLLKEYTSVFSTLSETLSAIRIRYSAGAYSLIQENGNQFDVWGMEAGTINFQATYNTDTTFGPILDTQLSANVSEAQFVALATERGLVSDHIVFASFDFDDNSSYALVFGRKQGEAWFTAMVLVFDAIHGESYAGNYRDATAMQIIRDLAVVSNRWLYVDRSGLVYMLPRSQTRGSTQLLERNTLSFTKKVRKEEDPDLQLVGYEENADGTVKTYGLRLRIDEIGTIKAEYRDIFSGEVIERELEMLKTDDDIILNDISWEHLPDFETIGTAISIKKSFLKPLIKVKVEYV
jgi:hypothetical protein